MNTTLPEVITALPNDSRRGFTFVETTGAETFYSFASLREQAHDHARRLIARGYRKGDRIALMFSDPRRFILCFLGASVAGLVPVPINPRSGGSLKTRQSHAATVGHIVCSARARGLLTTEAGVSAVAELPEGDCGLKEICTVEQLLSGASAEVPFPRVAPNDICFLQFTSGSTALPKGVVVTHRNLMANASVVYGSEGIGMAAGPDDVAVSWLPLHHDMGLIGYFLAPLVWALPTVLMPTENFIRQPIAWMEAMSRHRATITFAPNSAYALATRRCLPREVARLDLRHVRIAGCGAEPINANVLRRFAAHFAPAGLPATALMPAYGMAEATLAIAFHPQQTPMVTEVVDLALLAAGQAVLADPASMRRTIEIVSCGFGFPGHTLRIVDKRGMVIPERRVGEIVTRGPSITAGYFDQPSTGIETFANGWLRTGDLGYIADGRLYICGRIKDVIIIRGANHYPHDIEWVASGTPGVQRQIAVSFGVERDGTEMLVVCVEGKPRDCENLKRTVSMRVAEVLGLQVGHVAVLPVGSLPKTSSGKVQRRKVKALFEAGQLEEINVKTTEYCLEQAS